MEPLLRRGRPGQEGRAVTKDAGRAGIGEARRAARAWRKVAPTARAKRVLRNCHLLYTRFVTPARYNGDGEMAEVTSHKRLCRPSQHQE
jgi:hypothetical protein